MGTGNVTVVGKRNYNGKNSEQFSIIANSLATGTVSPIASKVYTGQPQLLTAKDLTITNSNGKRINASDIDVAHIEYYLVEEDVDGDLISDADGMFGYKIVDINKDQTIDNNDAIANPDNAGTYVVKIPLTGNYAGADALYQTYTIKPASIATGYQFETGNNAKKDNFKTDYTGKIIKFSKDDLTVTQLDAEGEKTTKTLNYGTEFTVETPKDAREVGEYNGVVKGAGNYTGEIPFTFNVVKSLGDVDIAFDVEEKKSNNKVSYIYTPYTLV